MKKDKNWNLLDHFLGTLEAFCGILVILSKVQRSKISSNTYRMQILSSELNFLGDSFLFVYIFGTWQFFSIRAESEEKRNNQIVDVSSEL